MAQVAKLIFGGGEAGDAAARQRQLQKVANERQLQQLNQDERRPAASRRNPRGRRLFVSDARGGLADTLGGGSPA